MQEPGRTRQEPDHEHLRRRSQVHCSEFLALDLPTTTHTETVSERVSRINLSCIGSKNSFLRDRLLSSGRGESVLPQFPMGSVIETARSSTGHATCIEESSWGADTFGLTITAVEAARHNEA